LSSAQYNLNGYVPPVNQPPATYVGLDISIRLPNSASLVGIIQDDGLPVPPGQTTSLWSKISGPGTVTFSSPETTQTSATFSSAGTYILGLTGNDGTLQSSDNVQVTVLAPEVTNLPPSIVITRPLNGKVFSYSRRLSIRIRVAASDSDGTISKIQYFANNQLIKETTSSSITWKNMPRGNYALVARAFDNKNATTDSTTVNVRIV
jgi:hypothetical protein